MDVNKTALQNLRPKVKKWVLKSVFYEMSVLHYYWKTFSKITFKRTFANTNITESDYILKKTKATTTLTKMPNLLD